MKKVLALCLLINLACSTGLDPKFLQRDRVVAVEKQTNKNNKNCLSYYIGYDALYDRYWVSSCNYVYSYQFEYDTLEIIDVNIYKRYGAEDLDVKFR